MCAAGYGSPSFRCFFVYLVCFLLFFCKICRAKLSRLELIGIGLQSKPPVTDYFLQTLNVPDEIARSAGTPWIGVGSVKKRRRRRDRKQKRGCRAGQQTQLKKLLRNPPVASVEPIANKMSDVELGITTDNNAPNCSMMIVTESQLHPAIRDS